MDNLIETVIVIGLLSIGAFILIAALGMHLQNKGINVREGIAGRLFRLSAVLGSIVLFLAASGGAVLYVYYDVLPAEHNLIRKLMIIVGVFMVWGLVIGCALLLCDWGISKDTKTGKE